MWALLLLAAPFPATDALLLPPPLPISKQRKLKVLLDPGHGAPDNLGAQTLFCEHEATSMLALAKNVAAHLEATERFLVRLTRTSSLGPSYGARVRQAQRWPADVLVSLHLDARGQVEPWSPQPNQLCWRSNQQPGFAVLVSDEVGGVLGRQRLHLARNIAAQMIRTGFLAYDGFDYGGLFEAGPAPGVFLDRRKLYLLRKPNLPSVIVETHHGLHPQDHARWQEPATQAAFARALAVALIQMLQNQ